MCWRTLASLGFAGLLACVVMWPRQQSLWLKPWCYLGTISYGIYLWHMPVLLTLVAKTPYRGWQLLAATGVGTGLLAALSWHGLERPWMSRHR